MESSRFQEMTDHDRRVYGERLWRMLNDLRSDPDTLAKIKARAAENAERGIG